MTESVRAVRASVQIGSLTVDGFMLPRQLSDEPDTSG